jgi:transposase
LGPWRDLLAPPARLAARRGVGAPAPSLLGAVSRSGPERLEPGERGQCQRPGKKGGDETGPHPTERGKAGSKRPLVVERHGIPLTVRLTAAKRPEGSVFAELIDGIKPIKRPRGRPRTRPDKLHAAKAYDIPRCRVALRRRGIKCRSARKGLESSTRLGRHRWVVERTLAWLSTFRRLTVRYERRADIHQAFLQLGCALICLAYL